MMYRNRRCGVLQMLHGWRREPRLTKRLSSSHRKSFTDTYAVTAQMRAGRSQIRVLLDDGRSRGTVGYCHTVGLPDWREGQWLVLVPLAALEGPKGFR
jgi:hypothetical protein